MPRSLSCTKAAGGRPSGTSRNGSSTRPAKLRVRSRRLKPRRQRLPRSRTSVTSRSLVRSAIAISASRGRGGAITCASFSGSTASRRVYRRLLQRRRRVSETPRRHDVTQRKAPDRSPGLCFKSRGGEALEAHVGAAAKDVAGERYVAVRRETAIEPAVEVAEIDIQVLGLHTHIADKADLEAGADRPAGVADAPARQARPGGIDVAEREPAGEVGHETVEAKAQSRARGGKPLVAGLARRRSTEHRGRAFNARPIDVAFRADHGLAELPVIANGAADEAT